MINIRVSEKPCNRKGFTAFEFRIRDNGIGMSEEFQEHVFDSFSRALVVDDDVHTCTSVSKMLREIEMRADWSTSGKEAGVTAFVEKPIFMSELRKVLTKPMDIKEEPLCQTERENRYSGKKVLLVEDNKLNREIATALLEEIGISVDSVEDGTDAVERMNEVDDDRYNLIFMDIQMPKMDAMSLS